LAERITERSGNLLAGKYSRPATNMKSYKAPWSALLTTVSAIVTILLGGMAILFFLGDALIIANRILRFRETDMVGDWIVVIIFSFIGVFFLAILFGTALFAVRGYTVTPDAILIRRLFWTTRLPLAGLQSATYEPDAMRRSLRSFGNGGLFAFSGWFYNKKLGSYQAFATNHHETVVLRYSMEVVVLSPSEPEDFVKDVLETIGTIRSQPGEY
jgi:hypothetical protein